MRPTIVIGSGDGDLCFIARHLLEHSGFATSLQSEANDIVIAARQDNVCALLIDGRVRDAVSACAQICDLRAGSAITIVALVNPGAHGQGLAFLNAGADEVFTRPVPPGHLLRALMMQGTTQRLRYGDIEMDVAARRVWRAECPVYLPRIEFAILRYFLLQPDRISDRREIIRQCWPSGIYVDCKTVNVHIGRLRRCLRVEGAPDPIRTVRGIGYGIGSVSLPERRARWRAKP